MDQARIRPEVTYRGLVDGGMLYDGRTEQVHHLNATAALIWEGRGRGLDDKQLAAALCERFEVDPERALDDVRSVLQAFEAAGLLEL